MDEEPVLQFHGVSRVGHFTEVNENAVCVHTNLERVSEIIKNF